MYTLKNLPIPIMLAALALLAACTGTENECNLNADCGANQMCDVKSEPHKCIPATAAPATNVCENACKTGGMGVSVVDSSTGQSKCECINKPLCEKQEDCVKVEGDEAKSYFCYKNPESQEKEGSCKTKTEIDRICGDLDRDDYDESTMECGALNVNCRSDSECNDPKLFCNDQGQCERKSCTADTICGDQEFCLRVPGMAKSSCVPKNSLCRGEGGEPKYIPSTLKYVCEDKSSCQNKNDCTGSKICENNLCKAAPTCTLTTSPTDAVNKNKGDIQVELEGTICKEGGEVTYKYVVGAESQLTATLSIAAENVGANDTLTVTIKKEGENAIIGTETISGAQTRVNLETTIAANKTGTYVITVSARQGKTLLPYKLVVNSEPKASKELCRVPPGAGEPGAGQPGAKKLDIDIAKGKKEVTVTGNTSSSTSSSIESSCGTNSANAKDVVYYFELTKESYVTLKLKEEPFTLSLRSTCLDKTDGLCVETKTIGNSKFKPVIKQKLLPGQYFVIVQDATPGTSGPFNLTYSAEAVQCTAGEVKCEQNTLKVCNAGGTGYTDIKTCGSAAGEICNVDTKSCSNIVAGNTCDVPYLVTGPNATFSGTAADLSANLTAGGTCTAKATSGKDVVARLEASAGEHIYATFDYKDKADVSVYVVKGADKCAEAAACQVQGVKPVGGEMASVSYTVPEDGTYYVVGDVEGTVDDATQWTLNIETGVALCTAGSEMCNTTTGNIDVCSANGFGYEVSRTCASGCDANMSPPKCTPTASSPTCADAVAIVPDATSGVGKLTGHFIDLQGNFKPSLHNTSPCNQALSASGQDGTYKIDLQNGEILNLEFSATVSAKLAVSTACDTKDADACIQALTFTKGGSPQTLRYVASADTTLFLTVDADATATSSDETFTLKANVLRPGKCTPGQTKCKGDILQTCSPDSTQWLDHTCKKPATGAACVTTSGVATCAEVDGETCSTAVVAEGTSSGKVYRGINLKAAGTNASSPIIKTGTSEPTKYGECLFDKTKMPAGSDNFYKVTLPAGEVLKVTESSVEDTMIYLLPDCDLNSCLKNSRVGTAEKTLVYKNDTGAEQHITIVVDSPESTPDTTYDLTLSTYSPECQTPGEHVECAGDTLKICGEDYKLTSEPCDKGCQSAPTPDCNGRPDNTSCSNMDVSNIISVTDTEKKVTGELVANSSNSFTNTHDACTLSDAGAGTDAVYKVQAPAKSLVTIEVSSPTQKLSSYAIETCNDGKQTSCLSDTIGEKPSYDNSVGHKTTYKVVTPDSGEFFVVIDQDSKSTSDVDFELTVSAAKPHICTADVCLPDSNKTQLCQDHGTTVTDSSCANGCNLQKNGCETAAAPNATCAAPTILKVADLKTAVEGTTIGAVMTYDFANKCTEVKDARKIDGVSVYYKLTGKPNDIVTVTVTPENAKSDLVLAALDTCDTACKAGVNAAAAGGAETLTLKLNDSGEAILVVGTNDKANKGPFQIEATSKTPNNSCKKGIVEEVSVAATGTTITGKNLRMYHANYNLKDSNSCFAGEAIEGPDAAYLIKASNDLANKIITVTATVRNQKAGEKIYLFTAKNNSTTDVCDELVKDNAQCLGSEGGTSAEIKFEMPAATALGSNKGIYLIVKGNEELEYDLNFTVSDKVCTTGAKKCENGNIVVCNETLSGFKLDTMCHNGCQMSGPAPTCTDAPNRTCDTAGVIPPAGKIISGNLASAAKSVNLNNAAKTACSIDTTEAGPFTTAGNSLVYKITAAADSTLHVTTTSDKELITYTLDTAQCAAAANATACDKGAKGKITHFETTFPAAAAPATTSTLYVVVAAPTEADNVPFKLATTVTPPPATATPKACTANEVTCEGDFLTVCNSSGTAKTKMKCPGTCTTTAGKSACAEVTNACKTPITLAAGKFHGTFKGRTATVAPAASCSTDKSAGPESIYSVSLQHGQTLKASVAGVGTTPYTDFNLWLATACQGASCLVSNTQTITYTNKEGHDLSLFLVVDSQAGGENEYVLDVDITSAPTCTRNTCIDDYHLCAANGYDQQLCSGGCKAGKCLPVQNNTCADATELLTTSTHQTVHGQIKDFQNSYQKSNTATCLGDTAAESMGKDAVYKVQLNRDDVLSLSLTSKAAAASLVVTHGDCTPFTSGSASVATCDAAGAAKAAGENLTLEYTATADDTYFIIVDSETDVEGEFTLEVAKNNGLNCTFPTASCQDGRLTYCSVSTRLQQSLACTCNSTGTACENPTGDLCADPIVINQSGYFTGKFEHATNTFAPTGLYGACDIKEAAVGGERYYKVDLNAGQKLILLYASNDEKSAFYLLGSSCNATSCKASTAPGHSGTLEYTANANETVYIVADSATQDARDEYKFTVIIE